MKLLSLPALAIIGLTACVSTESVSVARDAAAGSVLVSYDTSTPESPRLSTQHASRIASSQCKLLGYGSAEAVAHIAQQCSSFDSSGSCNLWEVKKSYKCDGNFMARDADTLRPVADNGVMRVRL